MCYAHAQDVWSVKSQAKYEKGQQLAGNTKNTKQRQRGVIECKLQGRELSGDVILMYTEQLPVSRRRHHVIMNELGFTMQEAQHVWLLSVIKYWSVCCDPSRSPAAVVMGTEMQSCSPMEFLAVAARPVTCSQTMGNRQ